MKKLAVFAAVLVLAGCAHKPPAPPESPRAKPAPGLKDAPVSQVPAFCDIAKPLTLALNDSPATQTEIRDFNTALYKRCGQEFFNHVK